MGYIQDIFRGSEHPIVFSQGMSLFEGCSMVPFKKAVLWFWMDNLVAHFTIPLSFRVSSDLCHTDIGERSGTANRSAGCGKTQVVWPHLRALIQWLCWFVMTRVHTCTHTHTRRGIKREASIDMNTSLLTLPNVSFYVSTCSLCYIVFGTAGINLQFRK